MLRPHHKVEGQVAALQSSLLKLHGQGVVLSDCVGREKVHLGQGSSAHAKVGASACSVAQGIAAWQDVLEELCREKRGKGSHTCN